MYKSDELELFPKNIEEIYAGLENDIMNDIIRRIAETGEITRTADWQLNRLYNMGADKTDIKKHIQEALNLSDTEIEQLYSDTLKEGYLRDESLYRAVGQEFIPFEENMALQQLIEATKQQTAKQLKNITRTMGFAVKQPNGRKTFKTVDDYFKDTMDNAFMHVLNGTFDYNSIIRKVTDEMTRSGVRSINYDSGISTRIDVAARRAILTGVNQVTSKINSDNMQKLDTEFVETSWHSTARPTHQVWQGRVFYWDRANPNAEKIEAGVLYKSFIRETGYGEVDGLCGANCRHTFYPFIPGISVRTYTDEQLEELNRQENEKKEYNGKEYNKYEATQYQRRLETSMRKYRQDISLLKQSGLADDSDEVIAAKCKYQTLSKKYSDFSEKMGLREHRDRVNVDGLKDIGNTKISKENMIEQSYKPVNLDKSNVSEINRGRINISTYKVLTAENNIYVSNNIRLKPKELHTIDLSISESLKKLKISDVDNLPRVVIINSSEMQTGALASYNAVKNVLYIDRTIGSRLKLLELQKDAACPKNVLSTYVHEYIHWMDAQSYRIGYGEIIDSSEYLYWIRHKSKKKIDKLINKGYNINEISNYANNEYAKGKYDEMYTEYRVKKLLGE
ncbi:phage minor capsid protein [Eubacterium ventriosum]|uniref:phage minor capsid protein n=1 Tax=Eubacterium ventriosum TaxID=39496 RepID=UPI00265E6383|nr:phage minor capsid protein [Eubacterium ventriosum]